MRDFSRRLVCLVAVVALLGAGIAHHHASGPPSHGTSLHLHQVRAPLSPEPDGPCIACALAAMSALPAVSAFQVQPLVHQVFGVRAGHSWPAPDTPELPGRSPPQFPA